MNRLSKGLFSPKRTTELAETARLFLAEFGTPALMGDGIYGIFEHCLPEDRFERLLSACGFDRDPGGFFKTLGQVIAAGPGKGRIHLEGVELPRLFLYGLVEAVLPAQGPGAVRTVERLEQATGVKTSSPAAMQQVLDQYPVRLSGHVIRQALVSEAVAAQYYPFEDELDPRGHTLTFDGHFKQGLMEQMYHNRAIFLLDMRCPVYCRFCFRKHKSLRRENCPSPGEVRQAVERVRLRPEIREILITGGEPLLNLRNLEAAMAGLMDVGHVRTLRIATRSPAYYPHVFLHHNHSMIRRLRDWQERCRQLGKSVEVGIHMVHPDEVSVQCLDIINRLTASGIPVYVQTPFLKGLNDTAGRLARLFTLLRHAGAEIYYIFTPCHPIHGTRMYWSPISLSIEAFRHLRETVSDRAVPKLCTATPLGKMEWHTSGWAVEPDADDPDHIWIRTPYTRAYFDKMDGGSLPDARENPEGTLDVKCLIDMGDENLFMGSRRPAVPDRPDKQTDDHPALLERIYQDPDLMASGPGPGPGLRRVHRVRLELRLPLTNAAIACLDNHPEITDLVVILPDTEGGIDRQIGRIADLMTSLDRFGERPFCVRIRWQAVLVRPEAFGPDQADRIAGLARLDFARPRRIEIETWWLIPGQVLPAHGRLSRALLARGVPVYGNLVLIPGVNRRPDSVVAIARALREASIDFHHVYVSGLSVQDKEDAYAPDVKNRILAIASEVRQLCSGREIPLYVIRRPEGEWDFGLDSGFDLED